jgi:hypothetical protein
MVTPSQSSLRVPAHPEPEKNPKQRNTTLGSDDSREFGDHRQPDDEAGALPLPNDLAQEEAMLAHGVK